MAKIKFAGIPTNIIQKSQKSNFGGGLEEVRGLKLEVLSCEF